MITKPKFILNVRGGNCHRIAIISALYLQELRLWDSNGLIMVCVTASTDHCLVVLFLLPPRYILAKNLVQVNIFLFSHHFVHF